MEEDIGLNWSIHWQVWKSRVRIFRNSIGEGRGVRRSVSKGLMISKGDSSPFCRGHLRQQGHLQPPHCQCMVWSKIYHHFSSINNFGISQTFPRKNLTAEAPYLGPVITTLVARLLFPLSTKIHFLLETMDMELPKLCSVSASSTITYPWLSLCWIWDLMYYDK